MRFVATLIFVVIAVTAFAEDAVLRMATTTSTDNTGLLDYLAPKLKADTGIDLQWVAVGTGKALKMGELCDIDVLLVHAPAAEKAFVEKGFGINRTELMYNDFIILGTKDDPAHVAGKTVPEALKAIADAKSRFISRGDNSGTDKKEKSLWKTAGETVPDTAAWYVQTGQGMLSSMTIAAEMHGYILADRGTYIKYAGTFQGNPPLKILVEGGKELYNQYSAITVNPAHCPNTKAPLAGKLTEWFASAATQKTIGAFTLLHKQLFIPNAAQ